MIAHARQHCDDVDEIAGLDQTRNALDLVDLNADRAHTGFEAYRQTDVSRVPDLGLRDRRTGGNRDERELADGFCRIADRVGIDRAGRTRNGREHRRGDWNACGDVLRCDDDLARRAVAVRLTLQARKIVQRQPAGADRQDDGDDEGRTARIHGRNLRWGANAGTTAVQSAPAKIARAYGIGVPSGRAGFMPAITGIAIACTLAKVARSRPRQAA